MNQEVDPLSRTIRSYTKQTTDSLRVWVTKNACSVGNNSYLSANRTKVEFLAVFLIMATNSIEFSAIGVLADHGRIFPVAEARCECEIQNSRNLVDRWNPFQATRTRVCARPAPHLWNRTLL